MYSLCSLISGDMTLNWSTKILKMAQRKLYDEFHFKCKLIFIISSTNKQVLESTCLTVDGVVSSFYWSLPWIINEDVSYLFCGQAERALTWENFYFCRINSFKLKVMELLAHTPHKSGSCLLILELKEIPTIGKWFEDHFSHWDEIKGSMSC